MTSAPGDLEKRGGGVLPVTAHLNGGSSVMRPRCFAHAVVTGTAIAAWVIAVALMCAPPGPNDSMRLPFFAFLGVAVSASSLAAFPWVMRGFIKDVVLAYVAGRFDERAAMEDERPALTVVR